MFNTSLQSLIFKGLNQCALVCTLVHTRRLSLWQIHSCDYLREHHTVIMLQRKGATQGKCGLSFQSPLSVLFFFISLTSFSPLTDSGFNHLYVIDRSRFNPNMPIWQLGRTEQINLKVCFFFCKDRILISISFPSLLQESRGSIMRRG